MNQHRQSLSLLLLCCLLTATLGRTTHAKAKVVAEMGMIQLEGKDGNWLMNMQIAHHHLQLKVLPAACRSWVKEASCKVCSQKGQDCSSQEPCFLTSKHPTITCDSAFCSRQGDYQAEEEGVSGIEAQIFCKMGKGEQALVPIVLATKLRHSMPQMGQFCLMDSDSSFSHGLLIEKGDKMQVINLQIISEEATALKDSSFEVAEVPVDEALGFGKGVGIRVRNQEADQFKEISVEEGFSLELSMGQVGVTVPVRLFRELERQVLERYFPLNSCHFKDGKIKCRDALEFGGLPTALLQFQFESGFTLSLPIHLLLGTCSARECLFALESHSRMSTITMGTLIWSTLALEWDVDRQKLWLYRLNNHWASLYGQQGQVNQSFLFKLLTLFWHVLKYLLLTLLGLALLSLLVNCCYRWRDLLGFFRSILSKLRNRRKGQQLAGTDQEDDYTVAQLPLARPTRGMRRLPDELEDQI